MVFSNNNVSRKNIFLKPEKSSIQQLIYFVDLEFWQYNKKQTLYDTTTSHYGIKRLVPGGGGVIIYYSFIVFRTLPLLCKTSATPIFQHIKKYLNMIVSLKWDPLFLRDSPKLQSDTDSFRWIWSFLITSVLILIF